MSRLACIALLVGLVLVWRSAARAEEGSGPAYLVKDIEPTGVPLVVLDDFGNPSWSFYGSMPRQLTEYKGIVLFVARDVAHGFELWRSDGTDAGTVLVKDICPEECSSELYLLGTYRDKFYFIGSDGVTGRELWRTDGTAAGTERLTDLCPGQCGIAPMFSPVDPYHTPWGEMEGVLYFSASNGQPWASLWRTDGTAAGTWQVKNVCVGTCEFRFGPQSLFVFNDRLYFSGGYSISDTELWSSDGTGTGTNELLDFCGPFGFGSQPFAFKEFQNSLFFATTCGPGGASIYRTDGTLEGTVQFASFGTIFMDIYSGFVKLADLLFFSIGGQVWRTDGTPGGTYGIADFGQVAQVTATRNNLLISAERQFGSGVAELFVSDGTAVGTFDIPGAELDGGIAAWAEYTKALFVGGSSSPGGLHSGELWVSDGSLEGTRLLQEINPGPVGSGLSLFRRAGSQIFFIANDGQHETELWAMPLTVLTGPRCFPEPTKLCLQNNRFEVSVRFKNQHAGGAEGVGKAVSWSDQSGTFTFFNPENTELVVKVLDGRAISGSFWFFFGALSNVEYWIEVKDWQTGTSRTYHNPPGEICGGAFLNDFPGPPDGTTATESHLRAQQVAPLRLMDGRLEVSVRWKNQRTGAEGDGTVLSGNGKTGFFSFFNPGNIELVVKALDGTPVNGKLWFFYGALSDVEYWINVRDTQTGAEKTYHNPPGHICGVGDTSAL